MGDVGKFLSKVSPAYGLVTGKGTFGGLQSALLGPVGRGIAKSMKKDDEDKKPGVSGATPPSDAAAPPGARKGGKLKKMCSGGKSYAKGGAIDGVARRGKTRCKKC